MACGELLLDTMVSFLLPNWILLPIEISLTGVPCCTTVWFGGPTPTGVASLILFIVGMFVLLLAAGVTVTPAGIVTGETRT